MSILFRAVALAAASCAATAAMAVQPVSISYDRNTWAFATPEVSLDGWGVDILKVTNGITIDFRSPLYVESYEPVTQEGYFHAPMAFRASKGYEIVGYDITYVGGYYTQSPGWTSLSGPGVPHATFFTGFDDFSLTGRVSGASTPLIHGSLFASGDQTAEGWLGRGYLQLDSITVRAIVQPVVPIDPPDPTVMPMTSAVPEPEGIALLLAGLPMVALAARRARRTA